MASVKVKFRASSVADREGRLYYQIIHNRVTRQINSGHKLLPSEWAALRAGLLRPDCKGPRHAYLVALKSRIVEDTARLERIIARLEHTGESYTAGDVVARYLTPSDAGGFFSFARSLVGQLRQIGKIRTGERYTTVLNSFGRFRRDVEVPWDEVDSDLTEWYTPEEIEQKYGMSRVAIRSHVYRNNIPSKKEHGQIFYSKLHFDLSKQTAEDNASEYYTVQEVMKKYNLTRDSVYGILQFHEIKREKKGRFVRFLKVEFDHVMGVRK